MRTALVILLISLLCKADSTFRHGHFGPGPGAYGPPTGPYPHHNPNLFPPPPNPHYGHEGSVGMSILETIISGAGQGLLSGGGRCPLLICSARIAPCRHQCMFLIKHLPACRMCLIPFYYQCIDCF